MSSLFSQASLVVEPAVYEDGLVYATKPFDGSGDLTFTRSNDTATRVNSAGLIEKVRTNLALYSEDLTNAAWTNFSMTVSANAGTAPNGTTTADKIIPTTSNTNHLIHTNVISSAGEYSFSVYVKADGYSKVGLRESQSVGFFASFDLTSATILDSSPDQNNTITSVGNGWFRITSTRSYSGGINLGLIPLPNSYTSGQPLSAYAGDGVSGILVWGAQMEYGVPTEYIGPTTSSAVSVGPVANLPRLDYSGGASCPSLLLEPQRTNALTFSESFDNAAWNIKDNVTITANVTATLDPSGYYGADKLVEDSSNNQHRIYRSGGGAGATFSFFAKAAERSWVSVLSNNGGFTYFNIGDGTLGTVAATSTAKITPYANGWYRCEIYNTHGSFGSLIQLALANDGTSYQGDGTSGAYIFGAQLEESATYATSYIPTLGASVTRGADEAYKTSITSLIGQTEGTIFVDLAGFNGSAHLITLGDGTSANYIMLYIDGSSIAWFSSGGLTGSGGTVTANSKAALAYKGNSSALYLDGVQILTNTSSTIPSLPNMYINNNAVLSNINKLEVKQALLFKTRLTNAQCQELTSL